MGSYQECISTNEKKWHFNPDNTILHYIVHKRSEIEIVDASGIHHKIAFFQNPRCRFLSDNTKQHFEETYPIVDDSTAKMSTLLRHWNFWCIENKNLYYYRVHR